MKLSSLLKQCAIAVVATTATFAPANAEPVLEGNRTRSECLQAKSIAATKFHSSDVSMSGPISLPQSGPVRFALHVQDDDISGGDGLVADEAYFHDVAPKTEGSNLRRIFWQVTPRAGKRIVVVDGAFNWQGDWYSMYVLDETVTPETLIADLSIDDIRKRHFSATIDGEWMPPQILVDVKSGNSWALLQGSRYNSLGAWTVHASEFGGYSVACTVRFMPQTRRPVNLLPSEVKKFDALLTEILGPGTDEGTLHPTTRIQLGADSDWANAAVRPWALNNAPYNSRAQVDANLKQWSEVNSRRRTVYRALIGQYPRAVNGLADYYHAKFHLRPAQAMAMARYATDLLYRDYFVFPGQLGELEKSTSDHDAPSSNPWTAR